MRQYGLLGKTLTYSFSRGYFSKKFEREGIADSAYSNFELDSIDEFPQLLKQKPNLVGLNVTIPYKESVLQFLDELSPEAQAIGAVNTIAFAKTGLIGYNTDAIGFRLLLEPLMNDRLLQQPALVLGTGGASKAIRYVLAKAGFDYRLVSRSPRSGQISYKEASEVLFHPRLVVNTTPVGTWPDEELAPPLAFEGFTSDHALIDLIYNPAQTRLMREAARRGAQTSNGLQMLHGQAEAAWEVWKNTLDL